MSSWSYFVEADSGFSLHDQELLHLFFNCRHTPAGYPLASGKCDVSAASKHLLTFSERR